MGQRQFNVFVAAALVYMALNNAKIHRSMREDIRSVLTAAQCGIGLHEGLYKDWTDCPLALKDRPDD